MLQAGDPLSGGAPDEHADGAARDEREAAFDAAVADVETHVQAAYLEADGWLEQTRAGLAELLRFCDEQPETAHGLVVDSIAWGPGVLERRGRLLDALAGALDRGRAERGAAGPADDVSATVAMSSTLADNPARVPPPATAENLVGACISLVHTRLLQVEAGSFLELGPALMSMIAHPYLGAGAARRELERPPAGARAAERESQRSVARVRERSY
jgi:hypothetical protein